ncbi:MAG: thiamine diphosphokinase [Lachnospiraceae bacterium]|nr:thiamine diphosphokinase [Lachnospiraceae bacterium]
MNTLIITGGGMDIPFTTSYIKEQKFDYIIAADKGVEHAYHLGVKPDYIMGDFDSISPVMKEAMETYDVPIETFPPEKDYTDTHLAMMKAMELGATTMTLVGATGTRLDHVMANIGLLSMALDAGVRTYIVDAHNKITMIDGHYEIVKDQMFGDFVSLIPYTEKVTGLTLKGFYYPVEDFTLTIGISRGISNEVVDEIATIDLANGQLLVIESQD